MGYTLSGPGVLHAGVRRGRWLAALLTLLLLGAGALFAQEVVASGWRDDFVGAVVMLAVLLGLAVLALLPADAYEVGHAGVRRLRRGRAEGPVLGRATAVRMRVEVRRTGGGSSRRTVVVYPVALRLEPVPGAELPHELVLASSRKESASRRVAEEVARHLQLPLEDAVGDALRVRAPDDLDAPYRPAPEGAHAGPVPAGVEPGLDPVRPAVVLRGLVPPGRRPLVIALAAVGASTSLLPAGIVVSVAGSTTPAWIGAGAFVALDLLLVGVVVGALRVRERIGFDGDRLVHELRWLGLRLARAEVPRREIEDLRVQGSGPVPGLGVVTDARTLRVGRSLDADGLRWLRAWIAERLA